MNNKAIFLVGGPGSGKDIILKDMFYIMMLLQLQDK
jgi:dephospho-CoA kinase